jgi:hypothetical protein
MRRPGVRNLTKSVGPRVRDSNPFGRAHFQRKYITVSLEHAENGHRWSRESVRTRALISTGRVAIPAVIPLQSDVTIPDTCPSRLLRCQLVAALPSAHQEARSK